MRPSRATAAVLLFVGLVFLVFGLVLVQVGTGDANEPEQRLLESLRRDGLISEAEYARKRAEILGERW